MKRAALVIAAVGVAHADPARPPAGWTAAPGSDQLTLKANEVPHFGGVQTSVRVESFAPPAGTGGLWITRAEARVAANERDAAATIELRELREAARRQGSARTETSAERADPASKQLEATVTWRDTTPGSSMLSIGRTVIAADADRVVAVTGECLLRGDAPAALASACTAALATLDPEIPRGERVSLAIVETPAAPDETPLAEPGPAVATGPAGPSRAGEPATLGAPPRSSGPMMTMRPATREQDRRPVYIGAFIVAMAAVFWWNRRRRDRFDREDAIERGDLPPSARESGDDDADDLAGAARGEAPKDSP